MTISSHETGDGGYFKVLSPDGKNFAEFKRLLEVAMGAPTRGKLWINGERVFGHLIEDSDEDYGFGPACAWSPDSNYLALIMWTPHRLTRCAIYDVRAQTLHSPDTKKTIISGYVIPTFQSVIEGYKSEAKIDLHKSLNIPVQPKIISMKEWLKIPYSMQIANDQKYDQMQLDRLIKKLETEKGLILEVNGSLKKIVSKDQLHQFLSESWDFTSVSLESVKNPSKLQTKNENKETTETSLEVQKILDIKEHYSRKTTPIEACLLYTSPSPRDS